MKNLGFPQPRNQPRETCTPRDVMGRSRCVHRFALCQRPKHDVLAAVWGRSGTNVNIADSVLERCCSGIFGLRVADTETRTAMPASTPRSCITVQEHVVDTRSSPRDGLVGVLRRAHGKVVPTNNRVLCVSLCASVCLCVSAFVLCVYVCVCLFSLCGLSVSVKV